MKTPEEFGRAIDDMIWSEELQAIRDRDAVHAAALARSREECERLRAQLGLVHSIASAVTLKRHGCDPAALHESLCNTGDFDTIGAREAAEMFERIASLAAPSQPEPVKVNVPYAQTIVSHLPLNEAPPIPENAGTTCEAWCSYLDKSHPGSCLPANSCELPAADAGLCRPCEGKGGFDPFGNPCDGAGFWRHCGLCEGTGRTR